MVATRPNEIDRIRARLRFLRFSLLSTLLLTTTACRTRQSSAPESVNRNAAAIRQSTDPADIPTGDCCAAGALANRSLLTELSLLFDTSDFPPRWHCGTWSRPLGWLHISSDSVIFLAYVTIPLTLVFFVRKRSDLPFPRLFWLFGAFIIFCGLTHLMEAIIFYWPAYRVSGLLKLATAVVSVLTAVVLIRLMPRALQLKSPSDLQQLADQRTTELLQANEKLVVANEQLAKATQAAEHANRTKSAFLANMSHEIRTPMTAILGFTELLADENYGGPEAQHAIQTVRRNGKHLLHVVNDILDLSKIEADQLEIEPIPISPTQLILDVCALHEGLATEKGLVLRPEIHRRVPDGIIADPTRLKQILSNLLTNAIKFTESGSVRLRARVKASHHCEFLYVDVIDTGIGLSEPQQARIFKPFAQADNSTTRRFGGTGLGLTISRRLAELMGGSLELVRSTINVGSHFRLVIAFERCHVPGASAPSTLSAKRTDRRRDASNKSTQLAGCNILLADDGVDNQRLFAVMLRNAGAQVTVVENGHDAMKAAFDALAEGTPFDVVLMDMQMPVMDGYTATRKLREADYTGRIIALTAHAMNGDREACIEAGCDDYISKPTQRVELIETLLKYVLPEPAGA